LTLRDNNHLETGMRQYENRSVVDPGTMASIEADVKGGARHRHLFVRRDTTQLALQHGYRAGRALLSGPLSARLQSTGCNAAELQRQRPLSAFACICATQHQLHQHQAVVTMNAARTPAWDRLWWRQYRQPVGR
jgi:hypothetical protein